ncbi:MAG: hypothetical protein R3D68_00595 [Hyphomicrobiaceae bacterium]
MISKKLLLLGDIGVGKTSLVRRFVLDEFNFDYRPTMGVDIYRYRLCDLGPAQDEAVELVIWDIDGNYGLGVLDHIYSRGCAGALIVSDLSRPATVTHMLALGEAMREKMPGRIFSYVLNKSDLCRPADAALPADLHEADPAPVATSALSGENVVLAFRGVAETILRRAA